MQVSDDHDPGADGVPTLDVLRCGLCHRLTYPSTAYGCRHCGAAPDSGITEAIPARGVLRNFVTVHADLVRDPKAPFVIGEVEFADGVIEEVLLEVDSETDLATGVTVSGVSRPNAPAGDRYPLRFAVSKMAEEV